MPALGVCVCVFVFESARDTSVYKSNCKRKMVQSIFIFVTLRTNQLTLLECRIGQKQKRVTKRIRQCILTYLRSVPETSRFKYVYSIIIITQIAIITRASDTESLCKTISFQKSSSSIFKKILRKNGEFFFSKRICFLFD